jgi:hypothetical protein
MTLLFGKDTMAMIDESPRQSLVVGAALVVTRVRYASSVLTIVVSTAFIS